jgi:hypothetical protein
MEISKVSFMDWSFEVDRILTATTYGSILNSGADTCGCNDCKNYVAYRDKVFPTIILKLFQELGIDYKKEVEISTYEILPNGFHHICGWFHFKGKLLTGTESRTNLTGTGYTLQLMKIERDFSIGFLAASNLSFFDDKTGLVQVEFDTAIPWIIHKQLEGI